MWAVSIMPKHCLGNFTNHKHFRHLHGSHNRLFITGARKGRSIFVFLEQLEILSIGFFNAFTYLLAFMSALLSRTKK